MYLKAELSRSLAVLPQYTQLKRLNCRVIFFSFLANYESIILEQKQVNDVKTQNFAAQTGSCEHAYIICKILTVNVAKKPFYRDFQV